MSFQGMQINPKKFHRSQIKFYLFLIPISLVMLLPIIYIVSHAFKPLDELLLFPPRFLVQKPSSRNFDLLFKAAASTGVPLSRYLFNSIIVVVVTIALTILISLMAAYVLSKKKSRGSEIVLKANQTALMFVPIAVQIPLFLIISTLGLTNNFLAHIIPALAAPVGLFLLKQFVDQIPNDLIEAARVDGANDFVIVTKIIFPLTQPALVTIAILTFQITWNSPISSTLYVIDEPLKTFAFYMNSFAVKESIIGQGMAAAAGLIMFLPNLIIFIFMQSKVMDTMNHSGVK